MIIIIKKTFLNNECDRFLAEISWVTLKQNLKYSHISQKSGLGM